ncbi:MAG: type 4a pilus biogenesis protein PilO, partial [Planctomycetota bacterium]
MNKLSEKQLLILTVAVTVLLAGGLGYLVWRDLEEVKQEEQKAADLRTQIRLAQVEIDQIPAREYRVIANREISDREVAFLPEETEIETFWEVLERFAVESGVQISKITQTNTRSGAVKRGAASSAIESVEQVLKLRGSADEFLRFMNLVENYDRIINVGEFSISSGKADEDGKIRHSIQMTLKTFTYSKKIANTIVSIPHYEKKKEHAEVKKWLSAIKLEEKETYTLRTSLGRRDPFADVRRKPADGVQPGGPDDRTAQEAILQTLIEQVRSLREGLDIEDHLRKINDLWRLAQQAKENREAFRQLATLIDNTRRENLVTIRDLQDRFQNDVIAPYQEIRDRLGKMEEDRP